MVASSFLSTRRAVTAAISALLLMTIGCSPTSRGVPHYNDGQSAAAALKSLSLRNDGGADPHPDGQSTGTENSDRELFRRWFERYQFYEIYHETYGFARQNYTPFPVPATLADAVAAQHEYEAEAARRTDQQAEQAAAKRMQLEAEQMRRTAKEAKEEAGRVATQNAQNAAAQEVTAKELAQTRADEACRSKRGTAALNASMKDGEAAGQRVWTNFGCRD